MSPIRLVRLGPDDWREFREVRLASLAEAPEAFGSTYDAWVEAPEERWRTRLTDVPLTLVARRDPLAGRAVGVVSGVPAELAGEPVVELISMWVDPAVRGTGVTARLIEEVVAWAAQQQRSTYLMVRVGNDRARRAYERAGFVATGVPEDFPPDVPPELRMVRPFGR